MSQQPFSRYNVQLFSRRRVACRIRGKAADVAFLRQHPNHVNNGEEADYSNRNCISSYSKGLPHDPNGEVIPMYCQILLRALASGNPRDFQVIPLGGGGPNPPRKLINSQSCVYKTFLHYHFQSWLRESNSSPWARTC
jgi:hypothetical protein